jgi:hypothetical protein
MKTDDLLALEIAFERDLFQSKLLSPFRRNPSTWELLLYLALFEDGSDQGLYNTVDNLQTRYLGESALLKFVRERRDDGLLLFTEHTKRSKWRIELNPDLREALLNALQERNAALLDALRGSDSDQAQTSSWPRRLNEQGNEAED